MAFVLPLMLAPLTTFGQSVSNSESRTAWGDPDLQGIWPSSTYTPLERPDNLGDQAFLSEEELASLNELLTEEGVDPLRARSVLAADSEEERIELTQQSQENIHYDNSVSLREEQPRRLTTARTSLIVDPPDGRIPSLTEAAKRRNAARGQYRRAHPSDGADNRGLSERCISFGTPRLPGGYNNNYHILSLIHI